MTCWLTRDTQQVTRNKPQSQIWEWLRHWQQSTLIVHCLWRVHCRCNPGIFHCRQSTSTAACWWYTWAEGLEAKFQETASLNQGNVMNNPNTKMMTILVMNLKSSMIMLLSWLCPDRTWSRSSWLFNLFCSLGWPPSPTLFSDVSVMCVHSRWIFLNQTQFFWSSIPILPSTTARPKGKAARQKSNIFFIWGLLVMYCPTCKIPKIP